MWSVILVLIAIFTMKLIPVYIEHSSITRNLKAIAKETDVQNGDINQARLSFSKRAYIDNIKSISGQDIKINKENGSVILSAQYTVKIPLISNISVQIDFEPTSH
jgi:hypothetical protein